MDQNIPIIDAHHHIWRVQDGPMLSGPMLPRLFGDYTPIKRDYLIEEFREDVESSGVVNSVYVKAAWPFEKAVEEALWVQSVFDRTGWPKGIVAYANFSNADVGDTLKKLAAIPNVKGIRQQLNWHTNPPFSYLDRPDLMTDPAWRKGFAKLQDHDLMFELQVFPSQMTDSVEFVGAFPDVRFVLLHAGMLEDFSPAGWETWRKGLKALAQHKNASIKLSGLGMFVRRLDPDLVHKIITECIAIFGVDRCIYGSNFPIEKIWTDYKSFMQAYRAPLQHLSVADQRKVLHDNAVRIYKL